MKLKIAIVPAGAWGTALAVPALAGGHEVRLWRRAPGWTAGWNRGHKALPGLGLPEEIRACEEVGEAVGGADLVVLSAAGVGLRECCRLIRPHLRTGVMLLSVTKGLEPKTHLRMSQVVAQEIPECAGAIAALSGPNFAHEVATGLPATAVAASPETEVARFAQDALMTGRFRIYTNPDLIGVELGGALKNIIALGAGISDGIGLGDNTRAALITRGLAEMARLGVAMGANPLTFAGLAGMGDLVLTCTGDSSRNRQAGLAIGRGTPAAQFVQQTRLTVEGIRTTAAAWGLARRLHVELPITEQIYHVLYEEYSPLKALEALMGRQKTHEVEEVVHQAFRVPNAMERRDL